MWVKATLEKFEEYGIQISTQRQLQDGSYILHMELTDYPEFFLATRFDEAVIIMDNDSMKALLSQENAE